MAPRLDQASRQRRVLLGLLADYDRLLRQVLALRELLKGSVYELKTEKKIGRASCRERVSLTV